MFAEVRSLPAWIRLFRALSYLAAPGGSITLAPKSMPAPHLMDVPTLLDAPILQRIPNLVRILEHAQHLLALAGVDEGQGFLLGDLLERSGDLRLAGEIFFGEVAAMPFTLAAQDGEAPDTIAALHIDRIELADLSIAYAATLTFRLDAAARRYRLAATSGTDLQVIAPDAFDAYAAARRDATAGQAIIHLVAPHSPA